MPVIVFGGTGMVGRGVLREALLAWKVTRVLAIGRSPTGKSDPEARAPEPILTTPAINAL